MKLKSATKIFMAIIVVLGFYGLLQTNFTLRKLEGNISNTYQKDLTPPPEFFSMIAPGASQLRSSHEGIPRAKQTVPGLYVTATEAYELWKSDQHNVRIIDCRTPEEYAFIGHPPMAHNIPIVFFTHRFDRVRREYERRENPAFTAMVKSRFPLDTTLLVICRSGHRSALAVNRLAQAGYSRVYNVIDGFEGDFLEQPGNPYHGRSAVNGWKNSNLPWTKALHPDRVYSAPLRPLK